MVIEFVRIGLRYRISPRRTVKLEPPMLDFA